MPERKVFTFSRSCGFSTPAFAADWYALSLKMSHPPKVKSFNSASGTNFLTSGERPSVRLPSRIVPSWVSEPTGCALPFLTNSTPAINVVLTAPIPGVNIPSFPLGSAIFPGFSMQLLSQNDLYTHTQQQMCYPLLEQTSNDERSERDLQIEPSPQWQVLLARSGEIRMAAQVYRGRAPGTNHQTIALQSRGIIGNRNSCNLSLSPTGSRSK